MKIGVGKLRVDIRNKLRWNGLQRSGTGTLRIDRPKMFYPIYIDKSGKHIISVGESLPIDVDKDTIKAPEGQIAIWPIFPDGREGRWRLGRDTLVNLINKHYVHLGKVQGKRASITYLAQGEQAKVENGDFPIVGYNDDGSIIVDESNYKAKFIPGTQWWITTHDATQKGTKILNDIVGHRFSFPKSLYAVKDALRFFVTNKPGALIVDFFAGSGTTLHAVNLLNSEDGGHRRCIMVTNNEVSDEEATSLERNGYKPGDKEWERLGIAQNVTWPRTICSIKGIDINGDLLTGEYITDLTEEKHTKRQIKQLNFVIPGGSTGTKIKKQIISLLGKNKLAQSLVKDECPYVISEDYPTAILFDDEKLNDFLDNLENQSQIRELYICTQDNKVLKKAKEAIEEILGDFIETVPVTIPMANGFKANAAFFKLGFLDKNAVALGWQFKELLPVLWMKAGCIGSCPQLDTEELPSLLMLPKNHFAVLLDETCYLEFDKQLTKYPEIKTVYIITDSESAYRNMIQDYGGKECYQLYRDYLDNFRINTGR